MRRTWSGGAPSPRDNRSDRRASAAQTVPDGAGAAGRRVVGGRGRHRPRRRRHASGHPRVAWSCASRWRRSAGSTWRGLDSVPGREGRRSTLSEQADAGMPERECRDSSPRVCGARSVASRISAAGACRDRCRRRRPYSRRERTGMSRGSVPGLRSQRRTAALASRNRRGTGVSSIPAWGWRTEDGGRDAIVRLQEPWRSALTRLCQIPAANHAETHGNQTANLTK